MLRTLENSLSNQIVDIVLTDTHKTLLTGDVFIGVGPAIKNKHEDGTESIADFDFYFLLMITKTISMKYNIALL